MADSINKVDYLLQLHRNNGHLDGWFCTMEIADIMVARFSNFMRVSKRIETKDIIESGFRVFREYYKDYVIQSLIKYDVVITNFDFTFRFQKSAERCYLRLLNQDKGMLGGFSLYMKDHYGIRLDRFSMFIRESNKKNPKKIIQDDFKYYLELYKDCLLEAFIEYDHAILLEKFSVTKFGEDAKTCLGAKSENKALNISFRREVIRKEDATVYTVCLKKSSIDINVFDVNKEDMELRFNFHWKILESTYRTTDASQFIEENLESQIVHDYDQVHSMNYTGAKKLENVDHQRCIEDKDNDRMIRVIL